MDDRTRVFFEEFGARGLGILTFSLMIVGAVLYGAEGRTLFQAQLLMSFCFVGSVVLLAVRMYRKGEFSLSTYSKLGPSPIKFIVTFLAGSVLAVTILRTFGATAWIQAFFGLLGLSFAMIVLWWYMERGD